MADAARPSQISKHPHMAARAATRRHVLFVVGLVGLVASLGAYAWIQQPLKEAVATEHELARDIGRIMTLDETLTMSAKMAASSHDPRYERRYAENVDVLDAAIKATFAITTDAEVQRALQSTDEANRRLVRMENDSFALNRDGHHGAALLVLESSDYQKDKALYAEGMARAFSRLERVTGEKTRTVQRWAVVLQSGTAAAVFLVVIAWALEHRARRKRAAEVTTELEDIVVRRTGELARRNDALRLVLDNVQQALVVVDPEGWMGPERSSATDRWFGPVGDTRRFSDYVGRCDRAFADWFDMSLELLREDVLPTDVALEQMPKRLTFEKRTFAVTYECVMSEESLSKILIVLSDITAEVERERVQAEQRDLLSVLEIVGRDRVGFTSFFDETSDLVDLLVTARLEERDAKRLLHTLKGNTAQFGMSVVSHTCHEIEERLAEAHEIVAADRVLLRKTWSTTAARVRTVLGSEHHAVVYVDRAELEGLVELVEDRHGHEAILAVLKRWELDKVQARLERLGEFAQTLAGRLGKPAIGVRARGGDLCIGFDWTSFWASCVHVVRNAVDHGIESPDARTAAGKPEGGNLLLEAVDDGDRFVVRLSDDGGGIDWERLGEKAAERGLPFVTEDDRIEVLFLDGLSTRSEVTETSGRGVGMSALRSEVLNRGGTIHVTSVAARGTTIEMRFPSLIAVPKTSDSILLRSA